MSSETAQMFIVAIVIASALGVIFWALGKWLGPIAIPGPALFIIVFLGAMVLFLGIWVFDLLTTVPPTNGTDETA